MSVCLSVNFAFIEMLTHIKGHHNNLNPNPRKCPFLWVKEKNNRKFSYSPNSYNNNDLIKIHIWNKESTMCVSRIMIIKHHGYVQSRDTADTENSTSSSLLVKLYWDGSLPYKIWLVYRIPCTSGCNENMNVWSWKDIFCSKIVEIVRNQWLCYCQAQLKLQLQLN